MSAAVGEALLSELGPEVVELGARAEGEAADASGGGFLASPRDGDELGRTLAWLEARKQAVEVRGGGTRRELGNPLREVAGSVSTRRLSGVLEFDAVDGVMLVAAGTPLADAAETARASGWELPLDAPGTTATVGGVIAAGASGPWQARYGPPRRAILGLSVVLASGERTRCGGRVVKNVTGYDMAKLWTGSLGTLGVIESAWLRLRPAPPETRTLVGVLRDAALDDACKKALEVSRRPSVRASALVTGPPASALGAPTSDASLLVVELAGDAAAVSADGDWLGESVSARPMPETARVVGRLREQQLSGPLRARLAVLPTALPAVLEALARAGVGAVAYPGAGLVYAIGETRDDLEAVDAAAAASGADLLLEALPDALLGVRDVFGEPGARIGILRALKERFDPAGILNPGRGQGRL